LVKQAAAAGFDPARLRQARTNAGLSQRELAKRAGIDQTTIAKYEAGDRAPFVERLAALAQALGVPPATLTAPSTGTLAELRAAAGLTQQAAATRAGLVRTTYATIERGEVATLDAETAKRLAAALSTTPAAVTAAHARARAITLNEIPTRR
jgi:transcriptional regulator with XRE-family HTH domain